MVLLLRTSCVSPIEPLGGSAGSRHQSSRHQSSRDGISNVEIVHGTNHRGYDTCTLAAEIYMCGLICCNVKRGEYCVQIDHDLLYKLPLQAHTSPGVRWSYFHREFCNTVFGKVVLTQSFDQVLLVPSSALVKVHESEVETFVVDFQCQGISSSELSSWRGP